jgi:hypothetical protein
MARISTLCAGYIVENANLIDTEPELRPTGPTQPLDPAAARLLRLVAKMDFHSVANRRPDISFQSHEVLDRFRREHNVEAHSGYVMARLLNWSNFPNRRRNFD